MNFAFRVIFAFVLAIALASHFSACSNGDDYLYDEELSTFIEISAEMAYSFDSSSTRLKSDTLTPADTLIFIANILPSKSIKIKRYLWTIDGEPLSYDFSFRRNIETPGPHKVAFFLETYLGDTLSDTLTLQISNLPVINISRFIPASGSQGIPTSGGVSFAWNAYDPDSIASLHYHFSIDGIIDTIVSEPAFTYWGNLPPLEHLHWNVQAINEFGFVSRETLYGDFFTRGNGNESGIVGTITASTATIGAGYFEFDVKATVLDSLGDSLFSKDFAGNSQDMQKFTLSPLYAGDYRIAIRVPEYPDFTCDTLDISLRANEVLDLNTIHLRDTKAPRISALIAGNTSDDLDTLDYSDTLRFIIQDFGTQSSLIAASAFLESTPLTETTLSGDTFIVVLPETMHTWNRRQLDIVATDASRNKAIHNYTLEGSDSWFETNPNTTISAGDSIRLYIVDKNHYGFKPDTFYFDTGKRMFALDANGFSLYSQTLAASEFDEGDNVIKSGIRYTNGIVQWKRWTLTRKDSTGGEP